MIGPMDQAMRGSPPMSSTYPLPSRPRLTPGIPAGGIAAIVVTLAVLAGSAIFGDPMEDGNPRVRFGVAFDGLPVAPPSPPPPPAAAGDRDSVARAVEEAMRGVDWAEIERSIAEATRTMDVEAMRRDARRAAEAARIEAHRLREQAMEIRGRQQSAATAGQGGALAANFDARDLRLVDVTGDIVIEVGRRDDIRVEIDQNAGAIRTAVANGRLSLVGNGDGGAPVDLRLFVPEGANLALAGAAGDVSVAGRAVGALSLDMLRGDVTVERATSAAIKVQEAGSVTINEVRETLRVAVFGTCDLTVERAGQAFLDIPGSGSVSLSRVGALTLSIPGHGEVDVGRVDGPVNAAFMGTGSVTIAGGEATPLRVAVTGAGEFRFDGVARDPVVLAEGSGSVHVARHTGKASVENRGQGTAWVGD